MVDVREQDWGRGVRADGRMDNRYLLANSHTDIDIHTHKLKPNGSWQIWCLWRVQSTQLLFSTLTVAFSSRTQYTEKKLNIHIYTCLVVFGTVLSRSSDVEKKEEVFVNDGM